MLQNTFLHIQGIGEKSEQRLWIRGVKDWQTYISLHESGEFAGQRVGSKIRHVAESIEHFEKGTWNYFDRLIPSPHKWRVYEDFPGQALYVDIETKGMGGENQITVIGTYDGREVRQFVAGIDLNKALEVIEAYPVIVTYNGAQFDMPVIRAQFRYNLFNHIHIDLRFPLHRLGYKGGLKGIERTVGIERSERTRGLDGWDAVKLWHEYKLGYPEALEVLLEYNAEDIKNLEPLMRLVEKEMKSQLTCPYPKNLTSALQSEPGR